MSNHLCTHSCAQCETIQVGVPSHAEVSNARVNGTSAGKILRFVSINGLQVLAGSSVCTFFSWAIAGFRKVHRDEDLDDHWFLNGGILLGHLDRYPDVPFLSFQWFHNGENVIDASLSYLAVLARESMSCNVFPIPLSCISSYQRTSDDNAARFISRRPEVHDVSSESSFNRLRDWLSACHMHHEACKRAKDSDMPSYILEITNTATSDPCLRLLSAPPCVDYAALSYCWGGDQPIKTTASTITDFTTDIAYSRLPKTLRDAVIATQKLGLRFLWVDSLCIVQDDPVQAGREIALMPKIYQNAYVTISAARSDCCESGFLQNIIAPGPSSLAFRFSFRGPDHTIGTVICFCEANNSHMKDPINKRAWTLQEHLLSPRILIFGAYQLTWYCLCSEENETKKPLNNWWMERDHRSLEIRNIFRARSQKNHSQFDIWSPIVEEYSRRNLSCQSDRLCAISGIATEVGQKANITYLAGIWREQFPITLLWEVTSPLKPRPSRYRAPSWSWAAVDGTIAFQRNLSADQDFKLLSEDVILKEIKAPYGDVEKGTITVKGWLVSLRWIENGTTLVQSDSGDAPNGEALALTRQDADDLPSDILVWCLQVCRYEPNTGRGPYGLILATENGRIFRRLGIFEFDPAIYHNETSEFYQFHREKQRNWVRLCDYREIIIE
jgi:hypothetical protein